MYIAATQIFVQECLANAEAGHDWWHTERVWRNAKNIAQHEKANLLVVELAALLHDIADSKFHNGNDEIGPQKAGEFLQTLDLHPDIIQQVVDIVANMSFHKSLDKGDAKPQSIELQIVQDADRLDAIGAIGIARTFHYGGYKNRLLYHPDIPPQNYTDAKAYQKNENPTINHFFEKLLGLKAALHTQTAQKIAEKRHALMEEFVTQFFEETGMPPFKIPSI